jgi:hypothetical protein
MNSLSFFESRRGKIKVTAEEAFAFVTDLRNFERFVSERGIDNWNAEISTCSFSVSMIGTVSVRITEKEKPSKVTYQGDALRKEDFTLILYLDENDKSGAEVRITLTADLNPIMKMMAVKPIEQFLEILVGQMENFAGWKDVRE